MARGGRLQTVERLGRHAHRGVITDCTLGGPDIVINGLGDTYQLDASLMRQATQDRKTAIAAHADERISTGQPKSLNELLRPVAFAPTRAWKSEGVTLVGGAQDSSAHPKERTVVDVEAEFDGVYRSMEQPHRTLPNTYDPPPITHYCAVNHGADNPIEAGAVTAACKERQRALSC